MADIPDMPDWLGAVNGFRNNLDATQQAAHLRQFIGTHESYPMYAGNQIVKSTTGGTQLIWQNYGNTYDTAQSFTMSGSTVGRVVIPVRAIGQGADLRVTLCPDSSGVPDLSNPLANIQVPRSWVVNMCAVEGLNNPDNGIQVAFQNTLNGTGSIQTNPWVAVAADASGPAAIAAIVQSGNYVMFLGGVDSSITKATAVCYTAQYLGGSSLDTPIVQPSLPQPTAYGAAAAGSNFVVYTGGGTIPGFTSQALVWVSGWDLNTGVLGGWSGQATLPIAVSHHGCGVWNDQMVYVVGGYDDTNVLSSVYYATISNGQILSWNLGPALPKALMEASVAVIGNWLVVSGGCTSFFNNASASTYISRINSDGTLGPWFNGPDLPTPNYNVHPGWDTAFNNNAMVKVGGFTSPGVSTNDVQILTFTDNTIGDEWQITNWRENGEEAVVLFDIGAGQFKLVNPIVSSSIQASTTLAPMSRLSIPLFAAGLTNGATYWIVLEQHQSISASDYLGFGSVDSAFATAGIRRLRHGTTWSAIPGTTRGFPISIYDANLVGPILGTAEDPTATGTGVDTNTYARTSVVLPDWNGRILGYAEAVIQPNDELNTNATFSTGTTTGWTPHFGTFVASSAQTHGGFAFSGFFTPTGGNPQAYVESSVCPIGTSLAVLGTVRWLTANGWFYSTTGTSNFSLSINWFDRANTYISTSGQTVTLPAATWTNLSNFFQAPSTAAFATVVPTESGTPTAANTFYMSNVTLKFSPELQPTLGSVTELVYPDQASPPIEVIQWA